MKKVIYENESSKLIVVAEGGLVEVIQYMAEEEVGRIAMYNEEAKNLSSFIEKNVEE